MFSFTQPQTKTHIVPITSTSSLTYHFSYKIDSLYEIKYMDNKSKLQFLLHRSILFLKVAHSIIF